MSDRRLQHLLDIAAQVPKAPSWSDDEVAEVLVRECKSGEDQYGVIFDGKVYKFIVTMSINSLKYFIQ